MFKIRGILFLLIGVSALIGLNYFQKRQAEFNVNPEYKKEIEDFRDRLAKRLVSPDGWLAVVGLHWLKEGIQTIGSSDAAKVILPKSVPDILGELELKNGKVRFKANTSGALTIDDRPAESKWTELKDDEKGAPSIVKIGNVQFFVINRKNGIGIRVKDGDSEKIKNFKGRDWYPVKSDMKVTATWEARPQKIQVPDILGNLNEEESPGVAHFEIDGEKVSLTPIKEGEDLFFIFKDKTSGPETYGAARFLYTKMPVDGKLDLDFNKAFNPPCAFTSFATCPMPIPENRLKVAIRAGELKPLDEH